MIGFYLIDRDPEIFSRILTFIRYGKLNVDDLSKFELELLHEDMDFYGLSTPTLTSSHTPVATPGLY